jgi:hypothetical protein
VLGIWDGQAWSQRIQRLDLRLRAWPATSLMMLLVALGAALLLAHERLRCCLRCAGRCVLAAALLSRPECGWRRARLRRGRRLPALLVAMTGGGRRHQLADARARDSGSMPSRRCCCRSRRDCGWPPACSRRAISRRAAPRRFFGWFLAALAGNLLLLVALDVVVFYLGFALMSFASYGLVVHEGDARAACGPLLHRDGGDRRGLHHRRAHAARQSGPIDFASLRAASATPGPGTTLIVGLLLVGFGIKAGVFGLHFWLPLAHPVAPAPASAVLSGAMIKAGLVAWMRLLPLGEAAARRGARRSSCSACSRRITACSRACRNARRRPCWPTRASARWA